MSRQDTVRTFARQVYFKLRKSNGMNHLLLPIFSFAIGILVGLTGVGGGSLTTPMLILLFNVPAEIAIGSDVVAISLTKGVGALKHWNQQTLDLKIVQWLVIGSVPGSLAGVGVLSLTKHWGMVNSNKILLCLVGAIVLLVALSELGKMVLLRFIPNLALPQLPKLDLESKSGCVLTVALAAVLGCMVGLTGIGSGSLFSVALVALLKLDPQKLVGTVLVQAAILLVFTALGQFSLGTVDWNLVLSIWVGMVPGVLLGAQLCQIAPRRILQLGIYLILVTVGWNLVHVA